MPFPLQYALCAGQSTRQTKGGIMESRWTIGGHEHTITTAVRQGQHVLVEAFVCRRCVNVVVRADSELEPAAVLGCYLDRDSDDLWPEQERIVSNIIINLNYSAHLRTHTSTTSNINT